MKYRAEDDGFTFSIEEVGLSLKFKGIKESFANGLIKTEYERKHWGGTDEINTKNAGSNDRDGVLIIRPL